MSHDANTVVPSILQPLQTDEYVALSRTELSERYGYPKLTPEAKPKILADNAARVYGIDLDQFAVAAVSDDLSWTNEVKAAYEAA